LTASVGAAVVAVASVIASADDDAVIFAPFLRAVVVFVTQLPGA